MKATPLGAPAAARTLHPARPPLRILRLCWFCAFTLVVAGSVLSPASGPLRFLAATGISDKAEHFGAYAFLAMLPCIRENRRVAIVLVAITGLVGGILELVQYSLKYRSCELADLVANAVGILAGTLVGLGIRYTERFTLRRRRRKGA